LVFDGLGNPVDNGTISVLDAPFGVAFSSAGELFVTGHWTGGISRFLFDVNGDAVPNGFTATDHLGGVAILAGTTSVGGIAELPEVTSDAGSSAGTYILFFGGVAALLALTAGAWYARRRLR
jgi:hypothetical protein